MGAMINFRLIMHCERTATVTSSRPILDKGDVRVPSTAYLTARSCWQIKNSNTDILSLVWGRLYIPLQPLIILYFTCSVISGKMDRIVTVIVSLGKQFNKFLFNSLAPGKFEWNLGTWFSRLFQWLMAESSLVNLPYMNVTRPYWW